MKKRELKALIQEVLQETIIRTPDDAVRFLMPHVTKISAGKKDTEEHIVKLIRFAYNTGAQSARQ